MRWLVVFLYFSQGIHSWPKTFPIPLLHPLLSLLYCLLFFLLHPLSPFLLALVFVTFLFTIIMWTKCILQDLYGKWLTNPQVFIAIYKCSIFYLTSCTLLMQLIHDQNGQFFHLLCSFLGT